MSDYAISSEERWRRNCSDDRKVTHVTERQSMNITSDVTVAPQSSWKTISVALKLVHDDDDDKSRRLRIRYNSKISQFDAIIFITWSAIITASRKYIWDDVSVVYS